MRLRNGRALVSFGAVLVFLLAAAGLSQPGQQSARRLLAALGGTPNTAAPSAPAAPATTPDVEQRARAHHGWGPTILDSAAKGSITWYDRSGATTRQGTLVIYRKFPAQLRVEVTSNQSTDVTGFDGTGPWRAGQASLTAAAARDIRQWLRSSPERLFIARSAGAPYREPGRRVEDHSAPTPWQGPVDLSQAREYDQAELMDLIGPDPPMSGPADRRRVTYLIDRQTSLIAAARWLEPADATENAQNPNARLLETRVEFSLWRDVAGVQWPYQITHWSGGRVDFQVNLTQVLLNQRPLDKVFQAP
jgi:hypothetical protein